MLYERVRLSKHNLTNWQICLASKLIICHITYYIYENESKAHVVKSFSHTPCHIYEIHKYTTHEYIYDAIQQLLGIIL